MYDQLTTSHIHSMSGKFFHMHTNNRYMRAIELLMFKPEN